MARPILAVAKEETKSKRVTTLGRFRSVDEERHMQKPSDVGNQPTEGKGWIPKGVSPADGPHMTDDFARVYELTATRNTGPVSVEALRRVGAIGHGTRILDIAAGTGALSIPAAHSGASVLAVDIAPGMVNLLSKRLAPFPNAEARLMNAEDLQVDDGSFDLAFSIFGATLFADWRKVLREQARAIRHGGKGVVATWHRPPGGGPFVVIARALRSVFPDHAPPAPPEGFVALSDPARLAAELQSAGFIDVEVAEIETVWEGPTGQAYLDELHDLHRYMAPYAALSDDDRRKVDDAILHIIEDFTEEGQVRLASPVLLGMGTRDS
jgi:SAM-dependent methyltransferase